MARAVYYPPANRSAQWYQGRYSGATIAPNVLVWHTTETGGWPGYGGGASAPHLTYHAAKHEWRQHFRLDRSSRALRNAAGGVETNTLNACQVEIIAYSDENLAEQRGHLPVSELDEKALRDLGDFARFMFDEWGLRLDIDPGWVRSNYTRPKRMTGSQWRNFYGHTGHNRVPENTHWDPARLDIDTIIDYARGGGMAWSEQIKSYVDKDGKDSVEHAIATTRRDAYRTRSTLFYSGDTNEKSVYATKSGYRRLDSPAYPGTEENPRPTGSSDPDRRGASWRYALQRVWRWAYWGYRRIVRVESKVDSLQQEIAALRGMVETLLQREAGQQVTVEQIRESVRAELLAADERIVNVQISVNDANDPEDDPDVAHDEPPDDDA